MTDYSWLSLSEIARYEPEMKRLGVSKVARSRGGFLTHFKDTLRGYADHARMPSVASRTAWAKKRNAFIARTLPQYKKNPTYRRWLALIAWAYRPDRRFG